MPDLKKKNPVFFDVQCIELATASSLINLLCFISLELDVVKGESVVNQG